MNKLITEVERLRKTEVKRLVDNRLKEFASFRNKNEPAWFSELCFCLLTANSKASTALKIQQELGPEGFCNSSLSQVRNCIIKNKHRFHNNKSRFIVEARAHLDIKKKIQDILAKEGEIPAREWLVKHIKGLGYKESSHFLRNTGCTTLSILDRHILNLMVENRYIPEKPKSLTKNNYLEIEEIFKKIALRVKMSVAELDMYMWYMKAGEVLK